MEIKKIMDPKTQIVGNKYSILMNRYIIGARQRSRGVEMGY